MLLEGFKVHDGTQEYDSNTPPSNNRKSPLTNTSQGNYNRDKDKDLVFTRESVARDVLVGNDNTGNKYWVRLVENFNRIVKKGSHGMPKSLSNRWGVFSKHCNWWSVCCAQVEHRHPSGVIESYYVRYFFSRMIMWGISWHIYLLWFFNSCDNETLTRDILTTLRKGSRKSKRNKFKVLPLFGIAQRSP